MITTADLEDRYDFDAGELMLTRALEHAISSPENLLKFLGAYIDWNGGFGGGVACLAAEIAAQRIYFFDADEPIRACSDRSVHVASYFFDAARDEFDDSATPHRDAHRSLAQATLKATAAHLGLIDRANELLATPDWLRDINRLVLEGYGRNRPDSREQLFVGMGFHLGSELLADREFTRIDGLLRLETPGLVDSLLNTRVVLAGEEHPAYYWIGIHSGHGGGVEMDHFDWAVGGVREALKFTPPAERQACIDACLLGFDAFADVHGRFFARVLEG
jgi:hypothetical protein